MTEPSSSGMTGDRPFKIEIFVAEGAADGLRIVEKSNWIGQGIICPRNRWPHVKKREIFSRSGVYILDGRDGEDDRPTIYVGQAETIRDRLDNHHANKDFWSQAVVFTTTGDPLNKAQVQYLEARLVELASQRKRCVLDNANMPKRPGLSEADQAVIEGYLDEMLSLMPVLGVHAFESVGATSTGKRIYHWKGSGWEATGFETNSGFLVTEGSIARAETVPSLTPQRARLREALIGDGVLVPVDGGMQFTVDYEFSAPSTAATVIAGRSTNGRTAWTDPDGTTLREHQEREAAE